MVHSASGYKCNNCANWNEYSKIQNNFDTWCDMMMMMNMYEVRFTNQQIRSDFQHHTAQM